mmetsp:Transcript_282/g.1240  ORF Transcript_282/g.1240 Transcript_282/m.1240 type:complete len:318 (-) Transcript_282:552-1505(-)
MKRPQHALPQLQRTARPKRCTSRRTSRQHSTCDCGCGQHSRGSRCAPGGRGRRRRWRVPQRRRGLIPPSIDATNELARPKATQSCAALAWQRRRRSTARHRSGIQEHRAQPAVGLTSLLLQLRHARDQRDGKRRQQRLQPLQPRQQTLHGRQRRDRRPVGRRRLRRRGDLRQPRPELGVLPSQRLLGGPAGPGRSRGHALGRPLRTSSLLQLKATPSGQPSRCAHPSGTGGSSCCCSLCLLCSCDGSLQLRSQRCRLPPQRPLGRGLGRSLLSRVHNCGTHCGERELAPASPQATCKPASRGSSLQARCTSSSSVSL